MSWISRLIGRRSSLDPDEASALAAYQEATAPGRDAAIDTIRFVVVDVETSGLDPHRDCLLAIGAVGVADGQVALQDSFEIVLRQERASDPENILIHRIDGTTQLGGCAPAEALARFIRFAGKAPLVGFRSEFDRIAIDRAMQPALGAPTANTWLDLAHIAPEIFPEHANEARSLDDWTRIFGIENRARHDALADALATAQLLLVALARAPRRGMRSLGDLAAASDRRWLAR